MRRHAIAATLLVAGVLAHALAKERVRRDGFRRRTMLERRRGGEERVPSGRPGLGVHPDLVDEPAHEARLARQSVQSRSPRGLVHREELALTKPPLNSFRAGEPALREIALHVNELAERIPSLEQRIRVHSARRIVVGRRHHRFEKIAELAHERP